MKISVKELQKILIAHKQWVDAGYIESDTAKRADLGGADLGGADLQGANLRGANLQGADLQGADLQDADLQYANLQDAYLQDANLQNADLQYANLQYAYLQDANLQNADLEGADLQGANLVCADLQDANLQNTYIQGAYLQGAYLQDAEGARVVIKKAPIQISGLVWLVTIWDNHMQIGCEFHSHLEWEAYDDARISEMASKASEFWGEWREVLLKMCKKHRSEK